MCFIIAHTPTRAYQRLRNGESVVETYDELLALKGQYYQLYSGNGI